jgi:hypothetical protein
MPPLSLPQSFFYFLGILSMPMFQCISEMTERPIVGFTVATTRVQASGKYTNACVCFLHYFLTFKLFTEKAFPAVFHAYDDHEVTHCEIEIKAIWLIINLQIINNFAGRGNDSTPPFPNASDAFRIYNAESNYNSPNNGQHYYYDFRYGDVAFFVMDTRRYRDAGSYDHAGTTMLGDIQLAALYKWLHKVCGQ